MEVLAGPLLGGGGGLGEENADFGRRQEVGFCEGGARLERVAGTEEREQK